MLWNFNSDLIVSSEMDSPLQFSQCFPLQWMGQRHSPSAQIPPFLQGFGLHVSGTAKRFDHLWYVLANSLQEYWCRRIISINTEITRINNFAISAINTSFIPWAITTPSKSTGILKAKVFADLPWIQWFSSISWKSFTASTFIQWTSITSCITATDSSSIWTCWKNSV